MLAWGSRRRKAARMARWSDFEAAAPALADEVRRRLDAHVHKTLATVRRDGSPRISGTEVRFADGDLWIGSMWRARKALDLLRDPRFALHSGSDEPGSWTGDAKIAGAAIEEPVPASNGQPSGENPDAARSHRFRLDLHEVSTV